MSPLTVSSIVFQPVYEDDENITENVSAKKMAMDFIFIIYYTSVYAHGNFDFFSHLTSIFPETGSYSLFILASLSTL